MDDQITTAERYRNRGEELRVIAAGMEDGNTRRILLSIAEDYDRMAQSLDAIAEREAPTKGA